MGLQTPDLVVEVAVSNMDMYPWDLAGRPHWGSGLEDFIPYLEKTGFRNIEVHPTARLANEAEQQRLSGETELVNTVVGSLHQTFNSGVGLVCKLGDWQGLERDNSNQGLYLLQRALARPVPSVYYPNTDCQPLPVAPIWESSYPGSFAVVQPCAELYRDFGINTLDEFLSQIKRLGYVGLCPDTAHSRRRAADGATTPPIGQAWPEQFASGAVYQMHVAADRFDMKRWDPELSARSVKEFKAFTSRRWRDALNTEMGDMIVAAIENYVPPRELLAMGRPLLRQVVEIPPVPRPAAFLFRVAQHARFVENLAQVIRETGATPLLYGTSPR